jgi:hypothetical protein
MSDTTSTTTPKGGNGLFATMSGTRFRHGSWYTPVLTALWLYAVAGVLTKIPAAHEEISWIGVPWLAVPVLLAVAVAAPAARAHMRSELDVTEDIATRAFWYALVATLAGGSWLLYALINTSPDSVFPAGLGWLVCATIAVGPWYGLLRRKKRVIVAQRVEERRVQRAIQYQSDWTSIMAAAGFPGMTVHDKLGTRSGYVLTMEFPPNAKNGFDQVKAAQKSIAICAGHRLAHQGLTIRMNAIRVEEPEDGDVRFVRIHVTTNDPLVDTMSIPDIGVEATIADGIEVGIYEDGSPIILPMVGFHTEVIGMTGSGKSALANSIFAAISRCPDALIWVAATAKLFPLVGPWCEPWWENPDQVEGPIFDKIGGQDHDLAMAVLVAAYQVADERSRIKRKGDKLTPSRENPLIVVALEESMSLLSNPRKVMTHTGRAMSASQICQQITQLGRSELVHLLRFDQFGLMDSAGEDGNKIRRNTRNRICLKTMYPYDGRAVLGDGTPDTTKLKNNTLLCTLDGEDARPVAGKSYFGPADPDEAAELGIPSIRDIAVAHDQFRGELTGRPAKKLGALYADRWKAHRIPQLLEYKLTGVAESEEAPEPAMTPAASAQTQKEGETTVTEPSGPGPSESTGIFGEVPKFGAAMEGFLRKQGIDPNGPQKPPANDTAKEEPKASGDGVDWDGELAKLTGTEPASETPAPAGRSVPEPLATLLAKLVDDEREFVEYTVAADLAGVSPAAELVRCLGEAPFDLPVQRPSSIEGRPRGWWVRDLLAAATRLRGEA